MIDHGKTTSPSVFVQMENYDDLKLPDDLEVTMESIPHLSPPLNLKPPTQRRTKQVFRKDAPAKMAPTQREAPVQLPGRIEPGTTSKHRTLRTSERNNLRAQLARIPQPDLSEFPDLKVPPVAAEGFEGNAVHARNIENESLEAAENGSSTFPKLGRMGLSGHRATSNMNPTTSTESDYEISRNLGKGGTGTTASCSSNDLREMEDILYDGLAFPNDPSTNECVECELIVAAQDGFEKSWKRQLDLTEEDRQRGYRLFSKIQPVYLGYCPRASDKRKYLKAYPIVGPIPDANCSCVLPHTLGQWSFLLLLFVFLIGLGAAGSYYFSTQ